MSSRAHRRKPPRASAEAIVPAGQLSFGFAPEEADDADDLPSSLAPPRARAAEIDALTAAMMDADDAPPDDGPVTELHRTTVLPIQPRRDTVGQRAFDLESRSIIGRAYSAWDDARGTRDMPSPVDLDRIDDGDLWSRFFVLDLSPARHGVVAMPVALPALTDYRRTADLLFLGETLHGLPGAQRRPGRLPDLAPCLARIVTGLMDAVIAVRHPLSRSDRYVPRTGPDIWLRLMLLPLSEDGRSVTQILGIACHSSTAIALPRPAAAPRHFALQ